METSLIIPALRRQSDLPLLKGSPADTVFLMFGELFELEKTVRSIRDLGKKVFLHTDLIKGLSQEKEAIKFIAEAIVPTGIVSTKTHIIKQAKNCGLLTVHHLFLIDTNAFESGAAHVKVSQPDAVEIMPGLMPQVIKEFRGRVDLPLLVGGLVKTMRDVQDLWEAGAHSIITGATSLWDLKVDRLRRVG